MKRVFSSFVITAAALAGVSCNDSKIVAGPSCPTASAPAAVTLSASPRVPRASSGAWHPSRGFAAAAAADIQPASAQQLADAMDISVPLTGISLRDIPQQAAAFNGLGALQPAAGSSFAWLATGVAGAGTPKALDPTAIATQFGNDVGGQACGANTYDCVQLEFSFVVPDNAHSVAFDFNFMSAEFPEFVNQGYNDTFTVGLASPGHTFANIVYDHQNNPINIDNAFFNQPCGELTGTGYDLLNFSGACDAGGTGLLTTQAPVNPGETVTMTFTVYDSGDGIYDSAVMIDNLRFNATSVPTPNTDPCTQPAT